MPNSAKSQREWMQRHPERKAAADAVALAVRKGDLRRAVLCHECGAGGRIEAHHDDYSRPLDVRWLCVPCHKVADVARRKRAGEVRFRPARWDTPVDPANQAISRGVRLSTKVVDEMDEMCRSLGISRNEGIKRAMLWWAEQVRERHEEKLRAAS